MALVLPHQQATSPRVELFIAEAIALVVP